MWATFVFAIIACLAALYVPGLLLFRGLGFAWLRALLIAPVATLAVLCCSGILYVKLGIPCNWMTMALPLVVLCCAPLLRRLILRSANVARIENGAVDWSTLALYFAVGVCMGVYVYVMPLGAADAFLQEYDSAFHVEAIAAFVDSGRWSVLEVSKYLTDADLAIMPLPGVGFYPALWHVFCAFMASMLGCPVTLAVNTVNFVSSSIVYPTGMMLFLAEIFRNRTVVRFGAACVLAFVAFPWLIMYWGPLYANAFSFALLPIAASLYLHLVDSIACKEVKSGGVCAFLLAAIVLVFAQTSALFVGVVLLVPYTVYRIWTHEGKISFFGHPFSQRLVAVLFVLFVVVVWMLLVYAPFMRGTVFNSEWASTRTPLEAVCDVLLLKFGWFEPQAVLATLVLFGVFATLRHRKNLWLSVSYLMLSLIFICAVSADGLLKHVLVGFWYCDSYRIASCMVFAAAPLAAYGLFGISHALTTRVRMRHAWKVVLFVLLCILIYAPAVMIDGQMHPSALGKIREEFYGGNHNEVASHHIFMDADEEAFVEKVKDLLPEDELVVNIPDDGSIFAYATSGLRTYYRDYRTYSGGRYPQSAQQPDETSESKLIRKYGKWVAENQSVRDAFESIGARYVLVLDQGESLEKQNKVVSYDPYLWMGLTSISDDTPGFEVVLSEGDMRLYRITALD